MTAKMRTLAYLNEEDKAYGLAGMAIAIAALDAMDCVNEISIDQEGPMVLFSDKYYFPTSSAISVKTSWDNLLHNFYITSAMVLSNVMSRSLIGMKCDVPRDILDKIHKEIKEEGKSSCSLEDDEIENIYAKTSSYMRRIFGNRAISPAIERFAKTIRQKRSLTANEILEELRLLHII